MSPAVAHQMDNMTQILQKTKRNMAKLSELHKVLKSRNLIVGRGQEVEEESEEEEEEEEEESEEESEEEVRREELIIIFITSI